MLAVSAVANIAAIVKERDDDSEAKQTFCKPSDCGVAYAAVHQARHGERNVQDVLGIVIVRIAFAEPRIFPAIKPCKILERLTYALRDLALVQVLIDPRNLMADVHGSSRVDAVGHVMIISTQRHVSGGLPSRTSMISLN